LINGARPCQNTKFFYGAAMASLPDQQEEQCVSAAFKVLVESPYGALTKAEINRNIRYARAALHDCFKRGELPWCSHLLYTQPGVLDDSTPAERNLGIAAGLEWGKAADKTVVYVDLGISRGMAYGIESAQKAGRPIEYRGIPFNELAKFRLKRHWFISTPTPVSRLENWA
jgi:hypothetical protein